MTSHPPRRFCCDEDLALLACDGLNAEADLSRWRHVKLYPATRELIEIVRREGVDGARVLDIGAGVGVAHAVRRSRARYFIHRHAQVERWMAGAGYQNVHEGGPREWRVVLYRRSASGRVMAQSHFH